MVDYYPLRYDHKDPEPEPEEDQEGQHPILVDLVYNTFEEQKGKTIALKLSLRLPLMKS